MKNKKITLNLKSIEDKVSISDGHHTFDELYDHRITLYIALCKKMQANRYYGDARNHVSQKHAGEKIVWRSKLHSDKTSYKGWFILGMYTDKGKQISYHIPDKRWKETDFAQTLEKAPKFDGHTSQDVLERIKNLL